MSSIIEAATKFKAWAAEHGILSYDPPEDLDEYAGEEISDITDANQAAAATQTLQNKKINFIGVNDTERIGPSSGCQLHLLAPLPCSASIMVATPVGRLCLSATA